MKEFLQLFQENGEAFKKVMNKNPNLFINLALSSEEGRVKNKMDEVVLGDYFITRSNRLAKVVAIGPIVDLEDDCDSESVSGQIQIIVFRDCLSNRLWSYSLDQSEAKAPLSEGIMSDLSVHEYQVVNDNIKAGYEVDMPLSGSNPVCKGVPHNGTILAQTGKNLFKNIALQYGVCFEEI